MTRLDHDVDVDEIPPRPSGRPRANHVTTINTATGEITRIAAGHSRRQVTRLLRRAARRRSWRLRDAAVTSWRLSRADQ